MSNHKCIIGLLHHYDSSDLCSLDDLKTHIKERIEYNKYLDNDPVFRNAEMLQKKVWTLKDYADKRKTTNLERFHFCPICGKEIDWKRIKREGL